jgi:hypothetical protein
MHMSNLTVVLVGTESFTRQATAFLASDSAFAPY